MRLTSVLLLFGLCACTGHSRFTRAHYSAVDMRNAVSDLMVPKSLVVQIEKISGYGEQDKSKAKSSDPSGGGGLALAAPHVLMVEKTKGILHGQNYDLQLGKGGGNFDLADYVDSSVKGDFYLTFDIPGIAEADTVKVFFLSHVQALSVGQDAYGLGCGKYADISSYYKSHMAKSGLRLTTLRDLYAQSLLGTFIFLFASDDRWQMAEVTITDGRLEPRFCALDDTNRSTVNL